MLQSNTILLYWLLLSGSKNFPFHLIFEYMKKRLVVLTGAGISAESGLKTFRDSDGLWEGYDVNKVATATAWRQNPALVQEFYNLRRRQVLEAEPNAAHIALASLEKQYQVSIVTQNIDDLHERGGSTNVLHLHGEILKMRSEKNDRYVYPVKTDIRIGDVAEDGAQLRPAIVWFEEPVPLMETAAAIVAEADVFVVMGTSLVVYPAASLLQFVPHHAPIIVVDKKAPSIARYHEVHIIEKTATEGVKDLVLLLQQFM